jgi:hypothetical protein
MSSSFRLQSLYLPPPVHRTTYSEGTALDVGSLASLLDEANVARNKQQDELAQARRREAHLQTELDTALATQRSLQSAYDVKSSISDEVIKEFSLRLCPCLFLPAFTDLRAGSLDSFCVNNVLVTIQNKRIGQTFHLWTHERFLTSSYFKGVLTSDFQEAQGVRDDDTLDSDGFEEMEDSDDEADAAFAKLEVAKQLRPCSDAIRAIQPKTYHIRTSSHCRQTYKTVLHYLQTNRINFSKLKSLAGPSSHIDLEGEPKASPKSVYKLSHYLDLPDLQELALKNLISQLTPEIAETELYSTLCQTHSDVRQRILDWVIDNGPAIKLSRKRKAEEQLEQQTKRPFLAPRQASEELDFDPGELDFHPEELDFDPLPHWQLIPQEDYPSSPANN